MSLISSGTSRGESSFYDASENGDDVYFITSSRLVSEDVDTSYDVYDAHVCSPEAPCSTAPVSPPPCTSGDSCKAAPSPQPAIFGAPASATFNGAGNVSPAGPATKTSVARSLTCKKGLVEKRHECVRKRKPEAEAQSQENRQPQEGKAMRRPIALRLGLPILVALGLLGGASRAGATEPWWHVNTVYAPAQKSGGEGTVDVEVSNLGDARTPGTWVEHLQEALFKDETRGFVTVVETLPAGLTVSGAETPVQVDTGGEETTNHSNERELQEDLELFGRAGLEVPKPCTISGQTVSCLYGMPVRPYGRIILAINVDCRRRRGCGHERSERLGGWRRAGDLTTDDLPGWGRADLRRGKL